MLALRHMAWVVGERMYEWAGTDRPRLEDIRIRLAAVMADATKTGACMSDIHPRVQTLARDLGAVRAAHLTSTHRREWLNGLARQIQVAVDDYLRGLPPDDRDWPLRPPRT